MCNFKQCFNTSDVPIRMFIGFKIGKSVATYAQLYLQKDGTNESKKSILYQSKRLQSNSYAFTKKQT